MSDTYRTIAAPAEGLYKDKGSKFLAFAYHVTSEAEIKKHLEEIKKKYFDARHHCYAYNLGPTKEVYRVNDDGEPSGTAGRPIHGQLLSADLTDTLIIVVRYFGGILLGTSGLITAYKSAARDAINNATIKECTVDSSFKVQFEYPHMNSVMHILKEYNLTPRNQKYDMDCSLEFSVRQSLAPRVEKAFIDLRTVTITSLDNA